MKVDQNKIIVGIILVVCLAGMATAGSFYYYETHFAAPNIHVGTNSTTQTDLQRPLVSTRDVTVYVNATGRNYTTIQDAINAVPYLLLHDYIIYVDDGTYDEDIIIPAMFIGDSLSATEGAVYGLRIYGTNSNMNTVSVNSISVVGVLGSNAPTISFMTVDGVEPRSDENVSISVYHSKQPQFTHINITGNSKYAIMGYSSSVQLGNVHFNNQENGVFSKRGSTMLVGSSSGGLFGTLSSRLIIANSGWVEIVNTSGLSVPQLVDCSQKGGIVSGEDNTLYCVDNFDRAIDSIEITPVETTTGLLIDQNYPDEGMFIDYDGGNNSYAFTVTSNAQNYPAVSISGGVCTAGRTGMYESGGHLYWCRAGTSFKMSD